MKLNHAEAMELAQMKQEASNLARCYIAARAEITHLRQRLREQPPPPEVPEHLTDIYEPRCCGFYSPCRGECHL